MFGFGAIANNETTELIVWFVRTADLYAPKTQRTALTAGLGRLRRSVRSEIEWLVSTVRTTL